MISKIYSTIRPEQFFLTLAAICGILFLILTPPFQVPDEPSHFFRAWQISEGTMVSVKQNNRVGGELPSAVVALSANFNSLVWSGPERKYDSVYFDPARNILLDVQKREFADFNNTALYSPLCYLPSSLAMFLLRNLGVPLFYIFYGARFFTLLFWIILVFCAIKRSPVCKWLMVCLALLPMSLFINATFSADVVTNAFCFLFISHVFFMAYCSQPVSRKDLFYLALLVFLVVAMKVVYAPLILILFILPQKKFTNKKYYRLSLSGLFAVAIISSLLSSQLIGDLYISYDTYHPEYKDKVALIKGADLQSQTEYLKSHGLIIFDVVEKSLTKAFDMYFYGYVGTFGWLNIHLPKSLVWCMYCCLIFIAMFEKEDNLSLKPFHRLLFATVFVVVFFLLILSQYLIWVPVGSDAVVNIQGRYLIPFVPFLFFAIHGLLSSRAPAVKSISMAASLISLSISIAVIYNRYY